MNLYEKYLKDIDENKLLQAIDVHLAMEKKYWKWFLNSMESAIKNADWEIFDILNIFKKLALDKNSLKSIKSFVSQNQAPKYKVSSSSDIKQDLKAKLWSYVSEKINSKIWVKIQSQNLGFQRSLESDLEKLLG